MQIDFEVADIRSLTYGKAFDIVLSVGLIEHFPDDHKAEAFELHRRSMNYGCRELMRVEQLGLYAHENGLRVRRAGYIKAHNGLVATDC